MTACSVAHLLRLNGPVKHNLDCSSTTKFSAITGPIYLMAHAIPSFMLVCSVEFELCQYLATSRDSQLYAGPPNTAGLMSASLIAA